MTTDTAPVGVITRTIAIPNDGLRQLANVALFAETDKGEPPLLRSVRLRSDGQTLTVEATDRYQAARERIQLQDAFENESELSEWDSFDVLADVEGVKQAKGKIGRYDSPVTVTVTDRFVTFDNHSSIYARAELVDAEPVKMDSFFEPIEGPVEGIYDHSPVVIGFNPQYLARLAKIRTEDRKPPTVMRWTIGNPAKSTQVEIGDTFRAVFMPVRVSS